MDRTALPRKLAVHKLSETKSGRYSVSFHGPPSIYHLRTDRAWAAQALALLRRRASSGAFMDSPDLLIAIDTVTSEIMAVRPLK